MSIMTLFIMPIDFSPLPMSHVTCAWHCLSYASFRLDADQAQRHT
eukprot:SAG31_NODE_5889_length_2272_cov_1.308790_5_plen_44_part_01